LEDLYLRARAGEDCMPKVLRISVKLDRLLAERACAEKLPGVFQKSEITPAKSHSIGTPSAFENARSS
jgi:hypothetical protein